MSNDDFTKKTIDANLKTEAAERPGDPGIRERAGRDLSREFNLPIEYGEKLAALSPDARKNVEIMLKHGSDRLEREALDQKRSHKFRVLNEENARMREVLRNPSLQIDGMPFGGQAEIDHIKEMAEKTVSRREESYRETIKDETRFSVDREIAADTARRTRGPERDPEHEEDREHD